MQNGRLLLLTLFLAGGALYSSEEELDWERKEVASNEFARKNALPADHCDEATDAFMEGYIQALIDIHYYEHRVRVAVRDHKVFLAHLPKNDLLSNSIIAFVRDIPGVKGVEVVDRLSSEEIEEREQYITKSQVKGVWFPQSTVLFPPLVAAPREPTYSAAYRFGDRVIGEHVAAVALGDDFPIFRWRDVFKWHGDLQIGIAAGVWAVFNFHHVDHNDEMSELVNTDYYLGIPLTYAFDRWAFRLRIYHISSHLGDEFLINHPNYISKRKNPSYEAIDFFGSYQANRHVRFYLGPGVVFHSDKTFRLKPLYVEYGFEVRVLGRALDYHRLYGTPFLAAHFENWQARHWGLDTTIKLGYEWSKLQGIGRKMRAYVDWHKGFSSEGQFFFKRTEFGEVGLSWGF
ncbi:MAG TPA: DUF1207 domain-containing protein [Parachlamydiales bacterium]|nr:DUF1207 domain-containing protein [Parachlamydiales bacterium]HCJ83071.1 DUF1207 domain-containing protein [Parachlamydiales bacterium]HKY99772.1 DUF1207 domain-containing protein [Rhabdochlamydiaceae bacterium]